MNRITQKNNYLSVRHSDEKKAKVVSLRTIDFKRTSVMKQLMEKPIAHF
jgi:hypothetical protein